MKCKKCGQEISEGHNVCIHCGSAVDFSLVSEEDVQNQVVETLAKHKKKKNNIRNFFVMGLVFLLGAVFVAVAFLYTGKVLDETIDQGTDVNQSRRKTTEKTITEKVTEETETTRQTTTQIPPDTNFFNTPKEYRAMPIYLSKTELKNKSSDFAKVAIAVTNKSEYAVDSFTIRIFAYDDDGNSIALSDIASEVKYIEKSFSTRGAVRKGETSKELELQIYGFKDSVSYYKIGIIKARSIDGYDYDFSNRYISYATVK